MQPHVVLIALARVQLEVRFLAQNEVVSVAQESAGHVGCVLTAQLEQQVLVQHLVALDVPLQQLLARTPSEPQDRRHQPQERNRAQPLHHARRVARVRDRLDDRLANFVHLDDSQSERDGFRCRFFALPRAVPRLVVAQIAVQKRRAVRHFHERVRSLRALGFVLFVVKMDSFDRCLRVSHHILRRRQHDFVARPRANPEVVLFNLKPDKFDFERVTPLDHVFRTRLTTRGPALLQLHLARAFAPWQIVQFPRLVAQILDLIVRLTAQFRPSRHKR